MTVFRYTETADNTVNYITTLALFCCVSCVNDMFKFGRFKTSLNFYGNNKKSKEQDGFSNTVSINGSYRSNRDEHFVYNSYTETQTKPAATAPPVPPPIPNNKVKTLSPAPPVPQRVREPTNTSDYIKNKNLPPNIQQTQSEVSRDPRGAESENRKSRIPEDQNKNNNAQKIVDKQGKETRLDAHRRVEKQRIEEQKKLGKQRLDEQKKLEKQRLEEEKKKEKLLLQERAKQEKIRKDKEKAEAQQLKKNKKIKKAAPQRPLMNPLAQSSGQAGSNPSEQASGTQYSTNTLDSSISKTSGPPPYSELSSTERNQAENNTNVSFSKPADTGSWDMISQHRNNVINRPMSAAMPTKGKTTLDLNYNLGEDQSKDKSSEI